MKKRPHPCTFEWEALVENTTDKLTLQNQGVAFTTVRSVIAWMRTKGELWTALRHLKMPRIKMGLRTIEQLQRMAPHLASIDLLLVQKHCDEVLPFSSKLEEVCFPRSSRMTDAGLCATLNACPEFRSLEFMECNQISDISMEHAMAACPRLNKIKLVRCTWVTGKTLLYLSGRSNGCLHTMSEFTGTKQQGVREVAQGAAKGGNGGATAQHTMQEASRNVFAQDRHPATIEWLELNQCDALCSASMANLPLLAPALQALSLKGCCAIDEMAAPHIASCTKLQLLDLAWVGIDDNTLRLLAEACPQLQVLGLSCCAKITDKGLWWLTPRCVAKRMRGDGVPERASHSQLQLRQLSLRTCSGIGSQSCHYIASWPQLCWVDLGGVEADPAILRQTGWAEKKCQQFKRVAPLSMAQYARHSHIHISEDFV